MKPVLDARDLAIAFGGVRAVDGVSLTVEAGTVVSIIGPNGAGKTTVFNLISGVYAPSSGTVLIDGANLTASSPTALARAGLSRTFQNLQIFARMSAAENVMVGRHRHERTSFLAHLAAFPTVGRENRESRAKAQQFLDCVGLGDAAETPASTLSYGGLKRLEIARALASEPKLLLLDEPAAGCNAVETAEIEALIAAIAASGVAVLLVEHDMRLVMRISSKILVLDRGRPIACGPAREVRNDSKVIEAYLGVHGSKEARRA